MFSLNVENRYRKLTIKRKIGVTERPRWLNPGKDIAVAICPIPHLHKSHNTPLLPLRNLHRQCFRILLGHLHLLREIANNGYAIFFFFGGGGGVKEVHYGICVVHFLTERALDA